MFDKSIEFIILKISEASLEKKYIISIDMGGTKILAAVINSSEGIIAKIKEPTKPKGDPKEYIIKLASIVSKLIEKSGVKKNSIKAVSLGIPGSLNPYTGIVGLAPNLGLKNFSVKEQLQKIVNIPVLIENDVNMGALGVKNFGIGRGAKNMLAVFVGTGIGGALFFEGKIYRGSSFVAGEIGHTVVKKNGPKCGCGNHGCLEAIASRSAIVKQIEADIKSGRKSVISKMNGPGKPIKSKMLKDAVKKKDKVVIKRVRSACEIIGLTLANKANFLNFDMIVLGGGVIEALHKFMLPIIKETFDKNVLVDAGKGIKIVASSLGDNAALFGGIALAEEFLKLKI